MNRSLVRVIILFSLFGVAQSTAAKDWFGSNNRFGGFGNSNGDCNDWPDWTPMYWMEEMSGSDDNCDAAKYGGAYGGYANPYQSYQTPYAYGAGSAGAYNPYLANPYAGRGLPSAYGVSPYAAQAGVYPQGRAGSAYGARNYRSSPFGSRGLTGFPSFGGNNFANPFSSFSGAGSPFSSFGGGSPWSSFGSPMGFGGMPGMSPMSPFSPMGGFGSPMAMGAMPGMGMPGMSPLSGFGGGRSSFMPF